MLFLYLLLRASSLSSSAKQLAATASAVVANIDFPVTLCAASLLVKSRNRSDLFSPTSGIGQRVFKTKKKVKKLF